MTTPPVDTKYTGPAKQAINHVTDVSEQKMQAKAQVKELSEKQHDLFIEAVKQGVSVTDLADVAQMSRRAIYRQLSTHEEKTGDRLVNRYDRADDDTDDDISDGE